MNVTRAQVLAYRALRHGFGAAAPSGALLDLGLQDTPAGAASLALSARGMGAEGLTMVWSYRGGPHLQRSSDLRWLAAALLPLDEDERAAVMEVAAAVHAVVTKPLVKGDLSARVTERVPQHSAYCRGCDAVHVNDQLLRLALLPGGGRIVDQSPLTVEPIPRWTVPRAPRGTERVMAAYLDLHGPATPRLGGGYLGTNGAGVRSVWPSGLEQVTVAGRKAWALDAAAVAAAEPVPFVRLLGPSDPYLQMRDRDLLVPDRAKAKTVWTVLGRPGAVVVDGEVVGTWRAAKKKRLEIAVTPWSRLSSATRSAVEEEAARVASVRGLEDVAVSYA